jgi:hypothetical protein
MSSRSHGCTKKLKKKRLGSVNLVYNVPLERLKVTKQKLEINEDNEWLKIACKE